MIIGVGTDIIEIERVAGACCKEGFKKRCYTENELGYINDSSEKFAGNFAVKEAVAKALGTGFIGFFPKDVECLRDGLGKPYVILYGGALSRLKEIGGKEVMVSISHSKDNAVAFAVIEG